MTQTIYDIQIPDGVLGNYMRRLVNQVFKILPIREDEEPSYCSYISSLLIELIGCAELIEAVHEDSMFMELIAILQYLSSHPECELDIVRREVFKAISLCNKLKKRYAAKGANKVV